MTITDPLLGLSIGAAVACFVSGLWGTQRHFVVGSHMPAGMRIVTLLSFAAWAWFVVRLARSGLGPAAGWGVAAMIAATVLFWCAVATTRARPPSIAFVPARPSLLYRTGPYRFIRHPFYASYVLCWIGTSLVTTGLLSWIVPAMFAAIYAGLALREERMFMQSDLAGAYRDYQRKTGMFFPNLSFPGIRAKLHDHGS